MKRFDFSLQRVLEYREFQKKQAQEELAKALSKEALIQEQLQAAAQSQNICTQVADSSKDFSQLSDIATYINFLRDKTQDLQEDMAICKMQSSQKRKELLSCIQKQKVLEKLKEKKMQEHKDKEQKLQDIEMDDIATSKKRQ